MDKVYDSIRDALPIMGRQILLVTCQDWDEVVAEYPVVGERISRVFLHLDDGSTLTFYVGGRDNIGFDYDGTEN